MGLCGRMHVRGSDRTNEKTQKEKIVVLGSGWAAIKFLQTIDTTNQYDVTVVSPRNYFLFNPFLPSCVVGTVEPRSIVEPIRQLLRYEARPFVRKLLQQDTKKKKYDHGFMKRISVPRTKNYISSQNLSGW